VSEKADMETEKEAAPVPNAGVMKFPVELADPQQKGFQLKPGHIVMRRMR